jgi:hypothetical protein
MTFNCGPLPEQPEFMPDDSWKLVGEPSLPGFQLRAIPIAFVTITVLAALWVALTPIMETVSRLTFPLPVLNFILCFLGVILVHELLHASLHPNIGSTKDTVIGFWPSRMFIYTLYTGELTKGRCVAILVMPFVAISIIPLVFAATTRVTSFWVAYMSIVNGFLACGDLLAAFMTATQFPKGAIIRTKGWSTYWKPGK